MHVHRKLKSVCIIGTFIFILVIGLHAEDAIEKESESSLPSSEPGSAEPSAKTDEEDSSDDAKGKEKITPLQKYIYLFSQHRNTQLEAVKGMEKFKDDSQRVTLFNVLFMQLFKTMEVAKHNLTLYGFAKGDPFPENDTVQEAWSKILENTAMFGDMLLHFPEAVHQIYDKNKVWQQLIEYGYGICKESDVFMGPYEELLNLMAQEANIIPKKNGYFNPFRNRKRFEEPKVVPKKPKKKIRRGPKLSHTEL